MRAFIGAALLAASFALASACPAVAKSPQASSQQPAAPAASSAPAADSSQPSDSIKAAEANFDKEAAEADAKLNGSAATATNSTDAGSRPDSSPSADAKKSAVSGSPAPPSASSVSSAEDLSARFGADFGAPRASGLPVRSVRPGTPAAAAALRPGDIITHLDGKKVRSLDDLHTRLLGPRAAAPAILRVLHRGAARNVRLDLSTPSPLDSSIAPVARGEY